MLFVIFTANKVISNTTYFCLKLILKFMGNAAQFSWSANAVLKTTSLG